MPWYTTPLLDSNQTPMDVASTFAEATPIQELRLFQLGDTRYLAEPLTESIRIPDLESEPEDVLLLTVVATPVDTEDGNEWLKQLFSQWASDDVLLPEFLSTVLFVHEKGQPGVNLEELSSYMREEWGTKRIATSWAKEFAGHQNHGPLVRWKGRLCKPYRLYDDPNLAFTVAMKPRRVGSGFENLRLGADFYSALSVAVPTRISKKVEAQAPLAGLRFAAKDIFDIEGMRITAGCRAFYDLSKPSAQTAPALQKLIARGAHLVGSLKLGSLITKEEPTESVDYHAPFNPRADGYQSAWSSSGGSGAAIASYDWLDFSLATDTTGSSRRPAMANGIFQHRLTQGAVPIDGIVPSFKKFDSPAVYTRDILKLETIVNAWIGEEQRKPKDSPISFVYPKDFWPIDNKEQMELVKDFISDFERTYDIKVKEVSLADEWSKSKPKQADSSSVQKYLDNVGVESFCFGVYHELDWFRDEYQSKFGRKPYINPTMQWRWDAAADVTKERHDKANEKLDVYRDWLLKEILHAEDTNTIVILPITTQSVDYRDVPPPPPGPPAAFDGIWLAPIIGAPEVTVPIGEVEYESRISGNTEHLPIVVSLLGSPGSDATLLSIVRKMLEDSGRPTSVNVGPRMFS